MKFVAPLWFLLAVPACAKSQDARLRQRLDAATAAAVTAIVDSAKAAKLPTEPLIQRALQGGAKQAGGPAIIAAVHELFAEIRTTRASIGAASPAELSAGAAALHAGATADELHMLKGIRPHASLTVAFATFADLVSHGVAAPKASETVRTALTKGASDAELIALRRNVERDIHAGAPPAAAAGVRAKGLQAKKAVRTDSLRKSQKK
jgi:hypothetical protein